MLHSGAPTERNSVCHEKNSSWTLSRMPRQSPSWSQLPVKFESVQTSWAVRIPRRVGLPLLSSQRGLREVLNLWGGGYGVCCHYSPRKSRIWRWRLFSPRRLCCWGPSSSWMQIRWKPLPSALAVDILPPIICHEGWLGAKHHEPYDLTTRPIRGEIHIMDRATTTCQLPWSIKRPSHIANICWWYHIWFN
jgi:hypothetical protein